MIILSIETSCDETAIAVLEQQSGSRDIFLRGNALASQIELHAAYGGVFPMMAKRAHAEKIVPLLTQALDQAYLLDAVDTPLNLDPMTLSFLDEKESALKEHLLPFLTYYQRPAIDYIAVTVGPGLEPALWVGINCAKALGLIWNIPVIPVNHMEGHVITALYQQKEKDHFIPASVAFPVLSLLVSGGHTELVLTDDFGSYKKLGQTRDDAVGEAFDKVARMLDLEYPGGPKVSKLAAEWRLLKKENSFSLPRPMLHSQDYDFSFSGIKTAVLYTIRDSGTLDDKQKMALAAEFEDAVVEVVIAKTIRAAQEYTAQTIIVGGGVASNTHLRSELTIITAKQFPRITILFPEPWLATDNAVMIGLAAYAGLAAGTAVPTPLDELIANGNLNIEK